MKPKKKEANWIKTFKRDWQLHTFMLPGFVFMLIFAYIPMAGLVMAFQKYNPSLGFFASKWVGLANFKKFFNSYQFTRVLGNTLRLSVVNLVVGFPLPVVFALFLNVLRNGRFKKAVQSITCIPHFISIIVVVGMMYSMLNPISGVYGTAFRLFGGEGYPASITADPNSFLGLYVGSDLWQQFGWNSIIYMAALSGVDPQLYEASMLDGASRWKQIWTIDLPAILPTVIIMLIINSGYILSVGYEKVYLMQSDLNLIQSEVISTYIYKQGLKTANSFSYATAIGMFNSVVNCIILVIVNAIARKTTSGEVGLF